MPTNQEVNSSANFHYITADQVNLPTSTKKVIVYCSSAANLRPIYHHSTRHLATLLSHHRCSLLYGGGDWGLMGEIGRTMYHGGCDVLGVMPRFMAETAGPCYGQVILVDSMAERKQLLDQFGEVVVVLPGGFGTLDEFSEVMTWGQIGLSTKVVGILNVEGFYDGLRDWIAVAVKEGMIKEIHLENLFFADTPEELVKELLSREAKQVPQKFRTKA